MTAYGILDCSMYVPAWRVDRAAMAKITGKPMGKGTRSVAAFDEDTATLAVTAAQALALNGTQVRSVQFAATNSPLREKSVAAIIHAALGLETDCALLDLGSSLKAGFVGLAQDLAAAPGSGARVTAVAGLAVPEPGSGTEGQPGDGAVAFLTGLGEAIAEPLGSAHFAREILWTWQRAGDTFAHSYSGRFPMAYGYNEPMGGALREALRTAGTAPAEVSIWALSAPDTKAAAAVVKQLGGDPAKLAADASATLGDWGIAQGPAQLERALRTAKPGGIIAAAAHGDGATALILRATPAITAWQARTQARIQAAPLDAPYYQTLVWRGILPVSRPEGPSVSNVLAYYDREAALRLTGMRCRACDTVQFPRAKVCVACGSQENEPRVLRRTGTVFTSTVDYLYDNLVTPTPMVVVDADGGGRLYVQGTDADPETGFPVGARVELVLRHIHEGDGHPNYFYKARPLPAATPGAGNGANS